MENQVLMVVGFVLAVVVAAGVAYVVVRRQIKTLVRDFRALLGDNYVPVPRKELAEGTVTEDLVRDKYTAFWALRDYLEKRVVEYARDHLAPHSHTHYQYAPPHGEEFAWKSELPTGRVEAIEKILQGLLELAETITEGADAPDVAAQEARLADLKATLPAAKAEVALHAAEAALAEVRRQFNKVVAERPKWVPEEASPEAVEAHLQATGLLDANGRPTKGFAAVVAVEKAFKEGYKADRQTFLEGHDRLQDEVREAQHAVRQAQRKLEDLTKEPRKTPKTDEEVRALETIVQMEQDLEGTRKFKALLAEARQHLPKPTAPPSAPPPPRTHHSAPLPPPPPQSRTVQGLPPPPSSLPPLKRTGSPPPPMPEMIVCPGCGRPQKKEDFNCGLCGAELEPVADVDVPCNFCNHPLPSGGYPCPNCRHDPDADLGPLLGGGSTP